MKSTFRFLPLLLLVLFSTQISFANEPSAAAIAELRSMGPPGLQTLMDQYRDEINRHIANPTANDEQWQRISMALDTVAQQKNSYVAGLYWYTDLDSAKKASAASGKPILSLRLLGKLTDEFSCANSRFFRTVLYPNAEVAAALRERFVLHWQSVRPVPVVTIDFGDGRKLERTLTGNSIHYILDSEGRPLDALPGLYGPQAFLRGLSTAETLFKSLAGKNGQARDNLLNEYYGYQHGRAVSSWAVDTEKVRGKAPQGFVKVIQPNGDVLMVAMLAVTKVSTEGSILRGMAMTTDLLRNTTDGPAWQAIAQLHSSDAMLDSRSISLIKRQNPALSDGNMARLLRKFQELIALDTVRNEYVMHTALYTWFKGDPARDNVEKFNKKVYASLFRTPDSDKWLGLFSEDVYMALDNGGVVKP
jgi:hypothetical protein